MPEDEPQEEVTLMQDWSSFSDEEATDFSTMMKTETDEDNDDDEDDSDTLSESMEDLWTDSDIEITFEEEERETTTISQHRCPNSILHRPYRIDSSLQKREFICFNSTLISDEEAHDDTTTPYTYNIRMKPVEGLRSILKCSDWEETIPPSSSAKAPLVGFSKVLGTIRCFKESEPVAYVGASPPKQSQFEWSLEKCRTCRESLKLSEEQMVVVHDVSFCYPYFKGIIYIRNLGHEKKVHVRYTCDDWKTAEVVEATYDYGIYGKLIDQFVFTIDLTSPLEVSDIVLVRFAVRLECHHTVFWDNNGGEDYYAKISYRVKPHNDNMIYDISEEDSHLKYQESSVAGQYMASNTHYLQLSNAVTPSSPSEKKEATMETENRLPMTMHQDTIHPIIYRSASDPPPWLTMDSKHPRCTPLPRSASLPVVLVLTSSKDWGDGHSIHC
jgi:hypothetical protein